MKTAFAKRLAFLAAALALIGAGCFQSAPVTAPPPEPVPTPAPAPAPEPEPAPTPEPTTPPDQNPKQVQLDDDFDMKIGDVVTVQDGPQITLRSIGDSRCKPNVQCIWAGELSPTLLIESTADDKKTSAELTLGTTTKQKADALGFSFTLVSADDKHVTLNVTK